MTPSEKIVADLSRSSFLSFWSFPNPKGKKNKELCDILVVCEPDIIIFSVKDISVKRSGNYNVDYDRWKRHAIDESIGQIYGAERIIRLRDEIFLNQKNLSSCSCIWRHRGISNYYYTGIPRKVCSHF